MANSQPATCTSFKPIVLALLAFGGVHMARAQAPKTVLDGVYTDAQASRGQAAYAEHCESCHGPTLDGGGQARPLHTSLFVEVWREDYLSSLYQYMQTRMPPGDLAGTLKENQYTDILAYILQFNKYPAGTKELTRETIDTTLLTGAEGPKPLPASSTVRAVGCFARAGDAWGLTRSSSPARVRNGAETDKIELDKSKQMPLGTRSFKLSNLEDDHPDAELQKQIGQKMQIKGVLNGQGETARIYVLSFEPLGQSCGQ